MAKDTTVGPDTKVGPRRGGILLRRESGEKFRAELAAILNEMEPRLAKLFDALSFDAQYTLLALGRVREEVHFTPTWPISFNDFAKRELAHDGASVATFSPSIAALKAGLEELKEFSLVTVTKNNLVSEYNDRVAFTLEGKRAYNALKMYLFLHNGNSTPSSLLKMYLFFTRGDSTPSS